MIDRRELEDMHRWHWAEGGLDNRHNAIGRLISDYSKLLAVKEAYSLYEDMSGDKSVPFWEVQAQRQKGIEALAACSDPEGAK